MTKEEKERLIYDIIAIFEQLGLVVKEEDRRTL
jgi:hypothetical protein